MIPTGPNLEQIADTLVLDIRRKPGQPVAFATLQKRLRLDQDTIEAALHLLASNDYRIRKGRKAVTFVAPPDRMIPLEIRYRLGTRWLGTSVHAYNTVKSTNVIAAQLAERGAVQGTIVTAERQTKGRGRLGRSWYSPPGTGIYVSIVLRPAFSPERAPGMSIMTATALADTVANYCPGEVQIKWPNDLLINGRKTAGILTELSAERGRIGHLIVGVGINVNNSAQSFPEELRKTATSLRRVLKRKVSRVELLQRFLRHFEKEYETYTRHGLQKRLGRIRRYSSLVGRQVVVKSGRSTVSGTAVDIGPDGSLIIETPKKRIPVTAGEVRLADG
ncbi:MAG TPA: biotin--[acetyl-CoA-carboxylase] ligase [Acidobacteriota bacterium]|nr:biotin--[acetyl-CoA-carboxylase] ligase [Acidobacteriota bacterium]